DELKLERVAVVPVAGGDAAGDAPGVDHGLAAGADDREDLAAGNPRPVHGRAVGRLGPDLDEAVGVDEHAPLDDAAPAVLFTFEDQRKGAVALVDGVVLDPLGGGVRAAVDEGDRLGVEL